MKDDAMFAFAGLLEKWTTGQVLRTYTILTTDPNELMEPIHNRMPVIIPPKDYERWMAPADPSHLPVDLLRPYPGKEMKAWRVSGAVGNVRNDEPEPDCPYIAHASSAPAVRDKCETETNCVLRVPLLQRSEDGDLMANNFLMLFKLDADTIAFSSLLVSIVGAVAAIFAAFYANVAAFYAKRAATKHDLTRVEQNTQYVEHFSNKVLSIDTPIHPQEKQEDSQAQAQQEPSQAQAGGEICAITKKADARWKRYSLSKSTSPRSIT
jgi:microcompartment protein CcmL/EutN